MAHSATTLTAPRRAVFLIDAPTLAVSLPLWEAAECGAPPGADEANGDARSRAIASLAGEVRALMVSAVASFACATGGRPQGAPLSWGYRVVESEGGHAVRRWALHAAHDTHVFAAAERDLSTALAAPSNISATATAPAHRIGRALKAVLSDVDWSGVGDLLSPSRDAPPSRNGATRASSRAQLPPGALFVVAAGPRTEAELRSFVGAAGDAREGKDGAQQRAGSKSAGSDVRAQLREVLLSSGALPGMYASAGVAAHWVDACACLAVTAAGGDGLPGEGTLRECARQLGGAWMPLQATLDVAATVPFVRVLAAAVASGGPSSRQWASVASLGVPACADEVEGDSDESTLGDEERGLELFAPVFLRCEDAAPDAAVVRALNAARPSAESEARVRAILDKAREVSERRPHGLSAAGSPGPASVAAAAPPLANGVSHEEPQQPRDQRQPQQTRSRAAVTPESVLDALREACEGFVVSTSQVRTRDFATAALRAAAEGLQVTGMSPAEAGKAVAGHVRAAILVNPRSIVGAVAGRDRQRERLLQAILRLELAVGVGSERVSDGPSPADPLPAAECKEIASLFFAMSFAVSADSAGAGFARLVASELADGYRHSLPQTVACIYDELELGALPPIDGAGQPAEPDTPFVMSRTRRASNAGDAQPNAAAAGAPATFASGLAVSQNAYGQGVPVARGGALHRRPVFVFNATDGKKQRQRDHGAAVKDGARERARGAKEGGLKVEAAKERTARKGKPAKRLFAADESSTELTLLARRSPRLANKPVSRVAHAQSRSEERQVHVAETPLLRRSDGDGGLRQKKEPAPTPRFMGVRDTPLVKAPRALGKSREAAPPAVNAAPVPVTAADGQARDPPSIFSSNAALSAAASASASGGRTEGSGSPSFSPLTRSRKRTATEGDERADRERVKRARRNLRL